MKNAQLYKFTPVTSDPTINVEEGLKLLNALKPLFPKATLAGVFNGIIDIVNRMIELFLPNASTPPIMLEFAYEENSYNLGVSCTFDKKTAPICTNKDVIRLFDNKNYPSGITFLFPTATLSPNFDFTTKA